MTQQWNDVVMVLRTGRTVDLRNVDASRLTTADECREVAAALRQRIQSINFRIRAKELPPDEETKAHKAVRLTVAARENVLGRMTFLSKHGDQNVEYTTDDSNFVKVARSRLGREVFEAIMAEARGMSGIRVSMRG